MASPAGGVAENTVKGMATAYRAIGRPTPGMPELLPIIEDLIENSNARKEYACPEFKP
jgi:hypothetical protein